MANKRVNDTKREGGNLCHPLFKDEMEVGVGRDTTMRRCADAINLTRRFAPSPHAHGFIVKGVENVRMLCGTKFIMQIAKRISYLCFWQFSYSIEYNIYGK